MRRLLFAMFLSMAFCLLQSCSLSDDMDNGSQQQQPSQPQPQPDDETSDDEDIMKMEGIPTCHCGGRIKPDVVLYEEGLDQGVLREAIYEISNADMLIVGGTSLVVYPAAGLIDYYKGNKLVLINKDSTARDSMADLIVTGKIGEILGAICKIA